jgi:hypothetical protein
MHLPSAWAFCTEVAVLGQWEGTCHAETLRGRLRLLQVAASLRGSPLDPLSDQPQVMAMIQDAHPKMGQDYQAEHEDEDEHCYPDQNVASRVVVCKCAT